MLREPTLKFSGPSGTPLGPRLKPGSEVAPSLLSGHLHARRGAIAGLGQAAGSRAVHSLLSALTQMGGGPPQVPGELCLGSLRRDSPSGT